MELQLIQNKIFIIRGFRVMLDFQLANLYEVETRILNQAVKRNIQRFPHDFMIQLSAEEWEILKSQFVISKTEKRGGTQKLPYAFTEQGVAMLSSVLKSKKAIDVNIAIMRAFVMLRQHLADYQDLKNEIQALEKEMNRKFKDINEALHYLLSPKSKPVEIGFKQKARTKK
ncbi:MAG: ORF6N domain-containing protein [Cyclobacteriaceae bacterium]